MRTFEKEDSITIEGTLVGTPTLPREIRAPHPRWVEEAGWWEETAGHSFNTGNSFFQEEFFSKNLVGTPTKPSPKERNRL
ncbi:hypothetical protein [Leptospira stimsonii]|uniref:Uncharacterized protein n=1 Tax=Leptospira stimsonii TaxID=2202203 RepID=A0ABY2MW16_9LEPT|nr:hypothetical protein [Leptospira stimsonii]TGK14494.1 hypothetical protein EHO98_16675 [Leptospira stimsonii]TGM09917.1 hypothetical protein EHQ90_19630 [Leptospira stimsonii]